MFDRNQLLDHKNVGLLIVDVQEKLFPLIDCCKEIERVMIKAIRGWKIFEAPIVVTEQYPQGLGPTIASLKNYLGEESEPLSKTHFSCLGDSSIRKTILDMPVENWVILGIEAHVCVMQTAKELLMAKKGVIILNDAIGSRSIYDFSTAIAELRDCGARITSTETILFELLKGSHEPGFKEFNALLKEPTEPCQCT